MLKTFLLLTFLYVSASVFGSTPPTTKVVANKLYQDLHLDSLEFNAKAFEYGIQGYLKLQSKGDLNSSILTIIDYSKPSNEKRLLVVDVETKDILLFDYIAHGRNSGKQLALKFSDRPQSYQSSLGFFKAAEEYFGDNGYSLRIDGLEKGINGNARDRAIVIHGADYADPKILESQNYLGRSLGCPSVSPHISDCFIETIKEGSLIFIYANQPAYFKKSKII